MWPCMSNKPGMTVLPVASITFAPDGTVDLVGRTDRDDAIASDDDRAAFDDLIARHGDEATVGEGHFAGGSIDGRF